MATFETTALPPESRMADNDVGDFIDPDVRATLFVLPEDSADVIWEAEREQAQTERMGVMAMDD